MSRQLIITRPAEEDIRANHSWWSDNRSEEQADRWLIEIDKLIYSLCESADRYGLATEIELQTAGIRQASFGLGRNPSHRVIFGMTKNLVIVYRVRAYKQDSIDVDDLTG